MQSKMTYKLTQQGSWRMTTHNAYSLVAAADHSSDELTLYEARKALVAAHAAGKVGDSTHISRAGRCVGFLCEWKGTVKSMFDANDAERNMLTELA